jgi:hypothetical protein
MGHPAVDGLISVPDEQQLKGALFYFGYALLAV